jgi:HlyD family secretion protein
VTVGLIDAGKAEISEGLSAGDVVVARAGAFLRDGDRVRAMKAPEPMAAK